MLNPLSQIFHVRREEKLPVLLGVLFFFFVMAALMLLRPAREALGMQRGLEQVRWLFMGTAVATLLVNPVFGWLVSRFRRLHFISATYGFFGVSLVVFWAILTFAPDAIGITTGQVFYVWFSVFNLFSVMVLWALLTDRFTPEQSRRFFPLIAAGGTTGAIFGPWLASRLAQPFGTPALLLVATGFLLLAVGSAWALTHVLPDRQDENSLRAAKEDQHAVIGGDAWGGFRAVFRSGYLLGIAAYVVILAIVLTFIYFTRLQMVAALGEDVDGRTTLFARLDMITQVATLVLQLSITGFLMKRMGVALTLALLPLTVMLGFIGLAVAGSLTMLVALDAASKAVQRAVMRPARETLFTVVSREDKYKAKAFIDTFVYRGGDVIGAQVEELLKSLGTGLFALTILVVPMTAVWALLGVWLGRRENQHSDHTPDPQIVPDAKGRPIQVT
jgi:AAA family ATP:ADP antiporter